MSEMNGVIEEGKTSDVHNDEGVLVREELFESFLGDVWMHRAPFVVERANMLSFVASIVLDSMVSSITEIMHSTNVDFEGFKKHIKCCSDCRKI